MDRDEAQNILQLYRPGNESDRNDPLIAEAFDLLETDAELRAWFEEQQSFDSAMSAHLEELQPPADLKAAILAGMRAHQIEAASQVDFPSEQTTHREANTRSKAWWLNPWVGIAALFVVMLAIFAAPRNGAKSTQLAQNNIALSGMPPVLNFLSEQIDDLSIFKFDKRDEHASELQSYLASTGAPSPRKLCDKMANTPTIGCVTFDYNNTKLSMICFKDGAVYHLITAQKAGFPDALPNEPKVFQLNDKAFKIWVEGDQVNILSIHGTEKDIPEFI